MATFIGVSLNLAPFSDITVGGSGDPRTCTVAVPAGAQIGDLLIAFVVGDLVSSRTMTLVPDGGIWSNHQHSAAGSNGGSSDQAYMVAATAFWNGVKGSYVYTVTASGNGIYKNVAGMLAYRGPTSFPWKMQSQGASDFFGSSSPIAPPLASIANAWGAADTPVPYVWAWNTSAGFTSFSLAAGLTSRVADFYNNVNFNQFWLADESWASASAWPSRTSSWTYPSGSPSIGAAGFRIYPDPTGIPTPIAAPGGGGGEAWAWSG